MDENTPYPPTTDASPYPPVSDSSIAAVPSATTTPYPPAADTPYPPATGTPYPPTATDTSNPLTTTPYPPASTPYPPSTDIPAEGTPATNAPTEQPGTPAGDLSKTDDAQPPPYSPPTGGYPSTTGYPPPSMMTYPSHPQPGFHPGVYQTAPPPPHNDAIIRSTQHGPQPMATTQVVVGFNHCPKCRVGILQDTFTPAGICCAILFFPLGLLCCLMMRRKICTHCGAIYM